MGKSCRIRATSWFLLSDLSDHNFHQEKRIAIFRTLAVAAVGVSFTNVWKINIKKNSFILFLNYYSIVSLSNSLDNSGPISLLRTSKTFIVSSFVKDRSFFCAASCWGRISPLYYSATSYRPHILCPLYNDLSGLLQLKKIDI